MGHALLSVGFPLHKQHSNHFPKKKNGNYEIPHQYPMYPFPEGCVSGPSGAADFCGEFLVFPAGGIDVSKS
jgi:hypothetical protein